jgi:hypothetical protein
MTARTHQRMEKRLNEREIKLLQEKGLYVEKVTSTEKPILGHVLSVQVQTLKKESIQTKDGNPTKVVETLLGIYRFRKSLFSLLPKDVFMGHVIQKLTDTHIVKLDLTDSWPFQAPIVSTTLYNVTNITKWYLEEFLYSVIREFKRQHQAFVKTGHTYRPESGFYFVPKTL